jgi:hypothetical protein
MNPSAKLSELMDALEFESEEMVGRGRAMTNDQCSQIICGLKFGPLRAQLSEIWFLFSLRFSASSAPLR